MRAASDLGQGVTENANERPWRSRQTNYMQTLITSYWKRKLKSPSCMEQANERCKQNWPRRSLKGWEVSFEMNVHCIQVRIVGCAIISPPPPPIHTHTRKLTDMHAPSPPRTHVKDCWAGRVQFDKLFKRGDRKAKNDARPLHAKFWGCSVRLRLTAFYQHKCQKLGLSFYGVLSTQVSTQVSTQLWRRFINTSVKSWVSALPNVVAKQEELAEWKLRNKSEFS